MAKRLEPGERFGKLVTVSRVIGDRCVPPRWLCRCDCGMTKSVLTGSLRSGNTRSCGCLKAEETAKRTRTHGLSGTPTHITWKSMIARCSNPSSPKFADYGARGIAICERWRSFENFLADMGKRPKMGTLERRNNDGNYEPENCEWATRKAQANNRRSNIRLAFKGKTMNIAEWSAELGVKRATLQRRYHAGWPIERILSK